MAKKQLYHEQEIPEPVRWLLKNVTDSELLFLDYIAEGDNFRDFISIVEKFKAKNVGDVFSFKAKDASELAYFRAGKVGEVAGLNAILIACEAAYVELQRRKEGK